jgi:hypothetical protein
MSWDVSIQKFSRNFNSMDEVPDEDVSLPLGPRRSVHEAATRLFPGTDWSDPAWGRWSSELGSIEFNLGEEDPADGVMLHVRAGPEVVAAIVRLAGRRPPCRGEPLARQSVCR